MNRSFDEITSREHFVVVIKEINLDGIWGEHPYNSDLISFFSLNHIISIHQEEVIDPSNPEHIKMIEEYERSTGKKIKGDLKNSPEVKTKSNPFTILEEKPPVSEDTGDATFIDIENLERLAEGTKRALSQYESFQSSNS